VPRVASRADYGRLNEHFHTAVAGIDPDDVA
jgi:hypothetical protein